MTALFINLKIDQQEKFNFFKVTLSDIERLFSECHIKVRGSFADDCIIFAKELFHDRAEFYQNLQEKDWVDASLQMIENVKSRSIFFYLEDHKLLAPLNDLKLILKEFDSYKLDYLCYSFFRASPLNTNNLLPLMPNHRNKFSDFLLDKDSIRLIRKISPLYCTFSCASICSTKYFKKILNDENKKFKIHYRKFSSLLGIFFSFPKYRIVINFINYFLSFIKFRIFFDPIDAPFNIEKFNVDMNSYELNSLTNIWKFGILRKELFANFDDDNNAYGESLIKRGLYPFNAKNKLNPEIHNSVKYTIKLKAGDFYDCTYYSQIHRIRILPSVFISVNYGKLNIKYASREIILEKNSHKGFYTNLSPIINCLEDAEIILSIYDECF